MSNVDEVDRWSQFDSEGPMVVPYAGCEIEPVAVEEKKPKAEAETSVKSVQSAAKNFSTSSVEIDEVINQNNEYIRSETQRFTMPSSGIEVAVHAPEDLRVNEWVFDYVFHAPIKNPDRYEHPEVRQLVECWHRDILQEKKYAGTVYHINISPPEHCIEGMRFQPKSEVDKCDATGATLPEIEISLLGFDVLNYNLMMLSSSKESGEFSSAVTKTLLHESAHAYMTLSDQPMRLDPDEKLAKYIENIMEESAFQHGMPTAFSYPSEKTVQADVRD